MNDTEPTGQISSGMLRLFASLADPQFVSFLAMLATEPATTADVAERLGVPADTIGGWLTVLGKAGVLETMRGEKPPRFGLRLEVFGELEHDVQVEHKGPVRSVPGQLATYFRGERIDQLPAQRSRQVLLYSWWIDDFEIGLDYPEAELNAIIARRHSDFATVRRAFIDEGHMIREQGIYRRSIPLIGVD